MPLSAWRIRRRAAGLIEGHVVDRKCEAVQLVRVRVVVGDPPAHVMQPARALGCSAVCRFGVRRWADEAAHVRDGVEEALFAERAYRFAGSVASDAEFLDE